MYSKGRIDTDSSIVKEKVHSNNRNISIMVIVLMGDEDCLKLLLSLKG